MAKAMVVKAGTPDEGPRSLRIGLVFWAVAAAVLVAGLVWLGPTETLDINSRDFFPLPAGFAFFSAAFGTYYVGRGVLLNLRFGKYGASTLDAGPAVLGRVFKGRIRTANDLDPQGPFSLRLSCVRETKTESDSDDNGGSGGIVTTPLWEAVASAPASTRSSAGVPFEFSIPADGLRTVTQPYSNGPNIKWTLHVAAPLKGLDYSATFPVIVGGSGKASKAARSANTSAPFAGIVAARADLDTDRAVRRAGSGRAVFRRWRHQHTQSAVSRRHSARRQDRLSEHALARCRAG